METSVMIGAHISSNPNDILEGIQELHKYGCQTVQLFVTNNTKYKTKYDEFKKYAEKNNFTIVVHASYTINLARNHDSYGPNIQHFISEIKTAYELGAKYIIVHMGKSMELSKEEAYNNMYMSLLDVHMQTTKYPIKILLETSSGQGSEMCIKLEDLSRFINKLLNHRNKKISERFGICVDTCHIYSAGYDINSKESVLKYIKNFDKYIGLTNLKVLHLNNSKTELNSNRDRHDNLNHGHINIDGLCEFVRLCFKLDVPIILETPYDYLNEDSIMADIDKVEIIKRNF